MDSSTVELRDSHTGALVAAGDAPQPHVAPPHSEQDPRDWWAALCLGMARALKNSDRPATDVRALSVVGQCHGLVCLDDHGDVLRSAKL